jgi:hypothetical protein
MNRRSLMQALITPDSIPAAEASNLGLCTVPTAQSSLTTVKHSGGPVRKSVITLAAQGITVTDALAYASLQLLDFPEGRILILGVTASLQFAVTSTRSSTINDSASLTWALGTAAASNSTLSSTMVDLLPKATKVLAAATTALNTASTARWRRRRTSTARRRPRTRT